jgi:hypothetical protein
MRNRLSAWKRLPGRPERGLYLTVIVLLTLCLLFVMAACRQVRKELEQVVKMHAAAAMQAEEHAAIAERRAKEAEARADAAEERAQIVEARVESEEEWCEAATQAAVRTLMRAQQKLRDPDAAKSRQRPEGTRTDQPSRE